MLRALRYELSLAAESESADRTVIFSRTSVNCVKIEGNINKFEQVRDLS